MSKLFELVLLLSVLQLGVVSSHFAQTVEPVLDQMYVLVQQVGLDQGVHKVSSNIRTMNGIRCR